MRLRILISFTCLLLISSANATEASQLLQQTVDAYSKAENLSMDILVRLYESPYDTTGKEMGKAMVRKSQGNYYSRFLDDEMIMNGKCCLLIDHYDKSITYCKSSAKNLEKSFSNVLDSALSKEDSVVYSGVTNGLRHFTIYSQTSYISQSEIYIDDVTHLISRIIYYYRVLDSDESIGAYKVELNYTSTSFSSPAKTWFDENAFINYQNGKPFLQAGYSSYTLTISEPQ